ncbi:MAG: hypothetical protein KAS15_09040 [Nanoarchaeota archaeon]|nr:hypothetical protein [Nanoarchaeota archaeon]
MVKNILRDLKPEEYFFIHTGAVIKNIKEFPVALKEMDEDTFRYHHNPQTNDFANWIKFLSDDKEFVIKIEKALTRGEIIKTVEHQINSVEKVTAAVKIAQKKKLVVQLPAKKEEKKRSKKISRKKAKKAKPKKKAVIKKKKHLEQGGIVKLEKDILSGLKKLNKKDGSWKKLKNWVKKYRKRYSKDLKGGIKEYLLGIVTGLLLGLILGTFI